MPLNIKNVKTYQLAHELVGMTGETLTSAITSALEERILRLTPKNTLKDELMLIAKDCATRVKPAMKRVNHGDYLYDDRGLPS